MKTEHKREKGTQEQPSTSIWEETLEGKDLSQVVPYSIYEAFNVDTIIRHTRFGIGVVVKRHGDLKIEVLFETGVKLLIHDQEH